MAANVGDQRSADWLVGLGECSPLQREREDSGIHSLEEEMCIQGSRVEGQASPLSFPFMCI